jgi:tryptophanyl-tRNA synthetase
MDLQNPTSKMSSSSESDQGRIGVLDDPKVIERKIKRAVTDTETEVRYDPDAKPGVSNLLSILAACTDTTPEAAAAGYTQYGPLKADTAAAVIAYLRPLQERYRQLADDQAECTALLARGSAKAREVAAKTLSRARDAVGLLPG